MTDRGSAKDWYKFAADMAKKNAEKAAPSKRNGRVSSASDASASGKKNKKKNNSARYEQLTLPGVELPEEKPAPRTRVTDLCFPAEDYRIDIIQSEKTTAERMALQLSDAFLSDFCRFCAIDEKTLSGNTSKTGKARLILAQLQQYPECLHYIFDWDEYTWIQKNCLTPGTDIPLPSNPEAVTKLQHLGLADFQFWLENGTKVAEVTVSADLGALFPAKKSSQLKRIYSTIEQNSQTFRALITLYGVIEFNELYSGYSDAFRSLDTPDDFLRFLNMHCMYSKNSLKFGLDDQKRFLLIHPVLSLSTVEDQFFAHPDVPYKLFSDDDIEQARGGLCNYYTAWDLYLTQLICTISQVKEEEEAAREADQRCYKTFQTVLEGKPLDQILESCRKDLETPKVGSIEQEAEVWSHAMQLAMETALPLFRGHPRSEALDLLGLSPDMLSLFPYGRQKKLTMTTHIADMEPELQLELYDMSVTDEDFSDRYDEILEEIGCANYEIRYLMIHELVMAGDYDRAETETKQLQKESGDKQLTDLLEYIDDYREIADDADDFEDEFFRFPNEDRYGIAFDEDEDLDDDFWSQPSIPYRREQPKIGRNDPCPCGSGKKYKHCCGR
ncbi:MAG: SEC-C domain-containing protein [Lachnospiraceae bacterium]|nr:SEC-C domain-containing protein [Lachnospiraceae bacterium]